MEKFTRLFELIETGDTAAAEKLVPTAYNELRRIAAGMMENERRGHTLQATALVNEAYLRLLDGNGEMGNWNSRGHFFSAAAEAMRRILIDSARRKRTRKRGAGVAHMEWDDSRIMVETPDDKLLALNEALERLEDEDVKLATVVKLRYFVGFTIPETAKALEISERNVNRQWECAKAWLSRELRESG